MAYEVKRIHAEQSRVVRSLFIDTADGNYITARWCFVEGLNVDYFWLSVHALEKYMKAALLLNGRSSKAYSTQNGERRLFKHDITALYEQVGEFASDLLPVRLNKPNRLRLDHWRDETPDAFIHRFYCNGNADNRYQIFGFVQHREDLFKLDLMVFSLRRLCVPLDTYFIGNPRSGTRRPTHYDILARQPDWWNISSGCFLEETVRGERGESLRKIVLDLNFTFCPARFRARLDARQDDPSVPCSRTLNRGTAATCAQQHRCRNRRGTLRLGGRQHPTPEGHGWSAPPGEIEAEALTPRPGRQGEQPDSR